MPKAYGTPGPRAIYPDACTSRSLSSVTAEAERLFWRIISQADDQGRLEGDVLVLRSLCVPLLARATTAVVERWLGELVAQRLISRYHQGDSDLVQVVTWWRWQAGMRRAYPSKWPAAEGWTDAVFGLGDGGPKTYREAAGLDKGARTLPAPSPQPAGNLPADSPQDAGTLPAPSRAQPLPVPSAGAGAGATGLTRPSTGGGARADRPVDPDPADPDSVPWMVEA